MSLVHIFGEMDLDLNMPADEVLKKAAHISEMCGYLALKDKNGNIVLEGEDAPDSLNVSNILQVKDNKIIGLQKLVCKVSDGSLIQGYIMEGVDDGYYVKWKRLV